MDAMSHIKPCFRALSLTELLEIIGWSKGHLAHVLHCKQRSVLRWSNGDFATPVNVRDWLELLAEHHWFHRFPKDWENG